MCITVTTVSLMPFSVGSAGRVVSGSAGSWPTVNAKTPENIILLIFISFLTKTGRRENLKVYFYLKHFHTYSVSMSLR